MNRSRATLLLQALRVPARMQSFTEDDWNLLVRQAAAAGLLGRLGALAAVAGIESALPQRVRRHLRAVTTVSEQQQRAVQWELVQLTRVLAALPGPVLLLKGAAYAAAGLAPAPGRLFSDIDLLVPREQLDAAEAALMQDGWTSTHHDAYDQRYYRQWMHELPPMRHLRRQTVLDVHHDILPETARLRTDVRALLSAAVPLAAHPRFGVLSTEDLVLHSATHLFHEGEWQHGLRDLADLDALLRAAAVVPGFWECLLDRAAMLGLGRPLFYALRYCERLLATPVPPTIGVRCPGRPSTLAAAVMDRLFLPAFGLAHHSLRTAGSRPAGWLLFVRSHWLRMPLRLLLPHLARKAWLDLRSPSEPADRAVAAAVERPRH